ncbi:hypothetical protein SS50377_26008 [Spironucleus salmonicida]|uniref:Uncharacterized protein n=1 Tax=Spironucleus salmonicida TaxID=348837 RepID=V6LJR9_9EUKA|nr:hypothetical protein SS50377_26008 [Spironucleus salmonicida]|eukprot:EST44772.1 Hypothetical protein SS50377_15342 [Spironucleus salmonicida]
MLIVLHFSCFDQFASVEYNYISASVLFVGNPQHTKSELCTYLEGKLAIPIVTLGSVKFVSPQITFSSNEPLTVRLECPLPLCGTACKQPMDETKCKTCQNDRQKACKDASLATIAEISFDFHIDDIQMTFAPSIYQVVANDATSCFQDYTLQYSPKKLVFTGIPLLCILQFSDSTKTLMASKTCKEPVRGIPQDCPWIQLLVNGEAISVTAYYTLNMLQMGQIEVECDKVLVSDLQKCENFMQVINSNQESFVEFQLAVAVERNIGTTKQMDMPIGTAAYYKGFAGIDEVLTEVDCFIDVTVKMFQDHLNVSLVRNTMPKACKTVMFDRVNLEIYGSTDEYFLLQNSGVVLPEGDGSVIMSANTARNATEYNGNISIALRGQRSSLRLILQYVKDNKVALSQEFKVSDKQETYRNTTLTIFDTQVCMVTTKLPWAEKKSGDAQFLLHIGTYEIQWQQQLQATQDPYCQVISQGDSLLIQNILNNQKMDILFVIDGEALPVYKIESATLPKIFWKQLLIILFGIFGFLFLIAVIFIAEKVKYKGKS